MTSDDSPLTYDDTAHPIEHFKSKMNIGVDNIGVDVGHNFDVHKDEVLTLGQALSRDASTLDAAAGSIPSADAGVMTQIIESEIAKILALAALLAKGTLVTGENVQAAAQNYRSADECAEQRFAQLQAIAARQDSNGSQPPRTLTELLISTTDRTE